MFTARCVVSLDPKLMERAEYHILSQNADVDTEPLKWPIAPDGYIPNSVIRSWKRKGKDLCQPDYLDDIFLHDLHQVDECRANEQEDADSIIFWFIEDEGEEEKSTVIVKRKKSENEDENIEKEEDKTNTTGKEDKKRKEYETNENESKEKIETEKARTEQMTAKVEDRIERFVPQQSNYIQTETTLRKHLKTDEVSAVPLKKEIDSRDSLKSNDTLL